MKESANLFRALTTPFRLHFQLVNGLDGLHYLSDIENCTMIEAAISSANISELNGFSHLNKLIIIQVPFNGFGVVDSSPLSAMTNLKSSFVTFFADSQYRVFSGIN